MTENKAWVTLATNDSYALGALVLAHSLKLKNTIYHIAVLVTPGVSPAMRTQLASVFNLVQEVDVLDSKDDANLALISRPELGITFTKLHCWNLTQYSKCVFLDADTLVIQNSDELFEREELSAAPDAGWPDCFNSGVFVFKPSKDTFKALLDFALSNGSFDGGDQGLLNLFFNDWATKDITRHLPFIYNMVSTAAYSYLPAFKFYGNRVKIVHFIGNNKPWLQCELSSNTLSPYLETWWTIFNGNVSKNLSREMTGLAGALAGGDKSAIEDQWRKQNWEQGVIDYMGKDSFQNIWQKISETIGLAPKQDEATKPIEVIQPVPKDSGVPVQPPLKEIKPEEVKTQETIKTDEKPSNESDEKGKTADNKKEPEPLALDLPPPAAPSGPADKTKPPRPTVEIPFPQIPTAEILTAEAKPELPTAEAKPQTPIAEAKSELPTAEAKPQTPTAEAKPQTPTAEAKPQTPTAEAKPQTPTAESKPQTPITEAKPELPTAEAKPQTPTAEVKPQTPIADAKPELPTAETKPQTPTAEEKPQTPTAEVKPQTPIAEAKPVLPTAEAIPQTPTAEEKPQTPIAEQKPETATAEAKPELPTASTKAEIPTAEQSGMQIQPKVQTEPVTKVPAAEQPIQPVAPVAEPKLPTPTSELPLVLPAVPKEPETLPKDGAEKIVAPISEPKETVPGSPIVTAATPASPGLGSPPFPEEAKLQIAATDPLTPPPATTSAAAETPVPPKRKGNQKGNGKPQGSKGKK